jgi:hypothetical protein
MRGLTTLLLTVTADMTNIVGLANMELEANIETTHQHTFWRATLQK